MKRNQILLVLILLFSAFSSTKAQSKYFLKVYYNETPPSEKITIGSFESYSDSLERINVLQNYLQKWRGEGYLTISVDSMVLALDTLKAFISFGEKYKWARLSKGNVDNNLLKQLGFREKSFSEKVFSINDFQRLQSRLIELAENQGHPFASVALDSMEIHGSRIQGVLNFLPGPFLKFDSVTVVGSSRLKPSFIANYFNMDKGVVFNKSRIDDAERFLKTFPSVKVTHTGDVIYSNYKAYPVFFLNHNPANIIDGIIGFLPNEQQQGKLLLTGQLNLSLYNINGSGRDLLVEWNKLKPLSQLLNFQFTNYNFVKTGLDVDAKFNLLKEDTTFINLNARLNLSKYLKGNYGRVNFFSEYKNSRVGSSAIKITDTKNPEIADFNIVSYGLGYQWQQLDDIISPREGVRFQIGGLVGNKIIKRNSDIDSAVYENISRKTLQTSLTSDLSLHKKLSKRSGMYIKLASGFVFNERLFISDLFRLGGLKSLRGFNENYFFAKSYGISNIEYRFFYEPESYFTLFYDQGYLITQYGKNSRTNLPRGLGVGLNLKTDAGIIQIYYSLGSSRNQSFNFSYSKVHFGIVNRF